MNEGCKMDKSIVNMEGAILIDDHTGNLETSNADMKISFGKRYSWNEDWKGIICQTWKEVETLIL
jgi:5'(3')-deoxyribonucleotidase